MTVSSTYEAGNVKAFSSARPYNRRLLRITSVVFAVALALFFVGLGGRIYMDRAMSGLVDQSSIKLTGEHRHVLTQWLAGIVREDVSAVHNAEVDMQKLNAQYRYFEDGSFFIYTEPDPDAKYDYSISEAANYTGELKASYADDLSSFNNVAQGLYGMKWTALRVAGYYWVLMLFGGILAVVSLIVWLAKGGRFSNFSDTAVIPLTVIFTVIGIAALLVFCFLSADFTVTPHIVIADNGVNLVR